MVSVLYTNQLGANGPRAERYRVMCRFVISFSAVCVALLAVAYTAKPLSAGDVCGVPVPPSPEPGKIISFHANEYMPLFAKIASDIGASDMSAEYQRVVFRFYSPMSGTVHVQLGNSALYSDLVNAMGHEGFALQYAAPGAYIEGETK